MTGHLFADPDLARLAALAAGVDARMETVPAELAAILDREEAGGETAAGEPAAAEPAAGPAAEPAAAEVPADEQPDAEGRYPEGLVKRLRTEAAGLRERAKSYEDVFGVYDEPDRQVWLDLARTFRENPEAAARWMLETGQAVLGANGTLEAPGGATPPAGTGTPPAPPGGAAPSAGGDAGQLTAEAVAKIVADAIAARERDAEQKRLVDGIAEEARQLGYDLDSPTYITLLTLAASQCGGDVAKAHALIQADQQKVIDQFVAKKAAEADTAAGGGGTTPSQAVEIKDLKTAGKAMSEWLDAQLGAAS